MAARGIAALGAAGIGVSAAVAAAAGVEQKFPAPKFSMAVDRFDKGTYYGRWATMLSNCDPSLLLASDDEVNKAAELLQSFEKSTSQEEFDDAELWAARKLKESAIHPDTGEIVPKPFRMSGYVPFNGPICVAMMMSTSTPTLLFWNWVNQSQNALVNYFNRNASSPTSNETLMTSYAGAVGAALTVAFGLSQFIKKRYSPARAQQLLKFVAFPSSVVASSSNCYIMRSPEIATGVELLDKDMNIVASGERSSIAASRAVTETVASRAILQVPVFFIPAVIMSLPPIAAASAASPVIAISLSTTITMIAFGLGLPGTVAIFPQYSKIDASEVEEAFQNLKDSTGEVIKTFTYNKGL